MTRLRFWVLGDWLADTMELSEQQLRWLLEGLEIEQKKAINPGKHGALY